MDVMSFRTPGLGDQTYLLTYDGKGVLVDPQRDIDRFLAVAAERDIELRFVLETHLHNDYVSGGEQAARRAGAELVLPAAAAAAYPHTPAFHLEDIKADGLTVRPIHTPGHTPEHTSYLMLVDGEPVALFSGGSLLVASAAGRTCWASRGRAPWPGCSTARCTGSPAYRATSASTRPTARAPSAPRAGPAASSPPSATRSWLATGSGRWC